MFPPPSGPTGGGRPFSALERWLRQQIWPIQGETISWDPNPHLDGPASGGLYFKVAGGAGPIEISIYATPTATAGPGDAEPCVLPYCEGTADWAVAQFISLERTVGLGGVGKPPVSAPDPRAELYLMKDYKAGAGTVEITGEARLTAAELLRMGLSEQFRQVYTDAVQGGFAVSQHAYAFPTPGKSPSAWGGTYDPTGPGVGPTESASS